MTEIIEYMISYTMKRWLEIIKNTNDDEFKFSTLVKFDINKCPKCEEDYSRGQYYCAKCGYPIWKKLKKYGFKINGVRYNQ